MAHFCKRTQEIVCLSGLNIIYTYFCEAKHFSVKMFLAKFETLLKEERARGTGAIVCLRYFDISSGAGRRF
jgi:hypothetical protein